MSSIFKALEKLLGSSDFLVNVLKYASESIWLVKPGADDDSHRLDKIKYSHPKVAPKTLRTSLHDSPSVFAEHNLQADVPA